MHQLILISIFSISLNSFASVSDLNKDYNEFQNEYNKIFNIKNDKKEFSSEFNKIEKELQLQYKNFVKKEKKKLTSEGNQMALDLEVLEPLRILAEGTITEKKCSEADFANDLNNSDNEKSYNQIKEQISLICNN